MGCSLSLQHGWHSDSLGSEDGRGAVEDSREVSTPLVTQSHFSALHGISDGISFYVVLCPAPPSVSVCFCRYISFSELPHSW